MKREKKKLQRQSLPMKRISWVILTYNRAKSVEKAITHCMGNAGYPWDEIVWCDNGSTDGVRDFMTMLEPEVAILNKTNLGVAKGYNRAMAMATGTHMVITGCDMLMPDLWMAKMVKCFDVIPNTGIVTIYASPMSVVKERIRGEPAVEGGIRIQPAMPIGRRMLPVSLQREIGYFNEGFGMYGWDDVAWGNRAEVVCKAKGLRYYNLPDMVAEHLGTEGNVGYDHKDEHEYWNWKKKQVSDPKKQELLADLRKNGWPGFNPYA